MRIAGERRVAINFTGQSGKINGLIRLGNREALRDLRGGIVIAVSHLVGGNCTSPRRVNRDDAAIDRANWCCR